MMHFNYVLTREDYKKFIYERNKQYNIIYFIIASIIYCSVMYKLLIDNPFGIGFLFVVYIFIILLFFRIYNKVFTIVNVKKNDNKMFRLYGKYKVIVDDNGIYEKNKQYEKKVLWNELKKIKINEEYIMIYINYNEAFFFTKRHLKGEQNFKKLIEIIQSKTKG